MRARQPLISALLGLTLATSSVAQGATVCTVDAMLVFDGSGSMSEVGFNQLDQPRIIEARQAVRRSIPQITPFRRLGLVVYGPGAEETCGHVDLRFPPTADAAGQVLAAVDGLQPAGNTPLTESVRLAAEVLNYREAAGAIVLVTDGKETCSGAPCQLGAILAADAVDLTVHVIGFKVRGDHFAWESQGASDYAEGRTVARCLADQTGGKYYSTETAGELADALRETLACQVVA